VQGLDGGCGGPGLLEGLLEQRQEHHHNEDEQQDSGDGPGNESGGVASEDEQ
jgi:hypothetical protein